MNLNPFLLNGTMFLAFYTVLILVISLVTWPWKKLAPAPDSSLAQQLRPEHWAILGHGLTRAAHTVMTTLAVQRKILWNDALQIYEAAEGEDGHPIVQGLRQGQPMTALLKELETQLQREERDLQQWGLLQGPQDLERQRLWILLFWGSGFMLGVARLVQGLENHRPIGFLLLLMVIGGFILWYELRHLGRRTPLGERLWSDFSTLNDHIRRAPPSDQIPTAVALGGPSALNGTDYSPLMWMIMPNVTQRVTQSDGGASYVLSCSSSDGGIAGGDGGASGSAGGSDGGGSGCGGCSGGD